MQKGFFAMIIKIVLLLSFRIKLELPTSCNCKNISLKIVKFREFSLLFSAHYRDMTEQLAKIHSSHLINLQLMSAPPPQTSLFG